MRRMGWAAGLALCAAGCAPTLMERVHNCNEDGVVLFGRGAYEPARQCFQAALTLQPDNADLTYNLGQCYDRLGNSAQAEQFYHNCLQRSPDHTECRHALALLLLREDRRQEAVQMVEEWLQQAWQEYSRLEHSPQLAAAFTEDGWLYAQSNDTERALKRYQQALFYDQHYARTLAEMGRLYEEMHYPDRALSLYQRALQINPNLPDIAQRVTALRKLGTGPPHPED
jgi:tetratricopeptide (TPR) repeat protein